jgi:ferritin-like metal-binding protein YciE
MMFESVKINDAQELFLADLASALKMEITVEGMLGTLVEEAKDRELKQKLRHHLDETQGQIRNIRQAFEAIGKEPGESLCLPIEGIEREGQAKLQLVEEALKDDVILAGCAKTEHLEIAVYENLIVCANALGHEDVAALMLENLEQEQHTLGEVLKAMLKGARRQMSSARS